MCCGCFSPYRHRVAGMELTPFMQTVVDQIRDLYKTEPAGGGLHIVTDDWNLRDGDVDFCIDWIQKADYSDRGGQKQQAFELGLAKSLQTLTEDERALVMATVEGCRR